MKNIIMTVCILSILLFFITACSGQNNQVEGQSASSASQNSSIAYEEFRKKAEAKGINEKMLRTFDNLGYTQEEILNLTSDEISEIFAPGTLLDGVGFEPDEKQIKELNKIGIDTEMSTILYNLGYKYEEMLQLSPEEINFIFPNTELIGNLVEKGFNEEEVQKGTVLESGKSYKVLIKEALKR